MDPTATRLEVIQIRRDLRRLEQCLHQATAPSGLGPAIARRQLPDTQRIDDTRDSLSRLRGAIPDEDFQVLSRRFAAVVDGLKECSRQQSDAIEVKPAAAPPLEETPEVPAELPKISEEAETVRTERSAPIVESLRRSLDSGQTQSWAEATLPLIMVAVDLDDPGARELRSVAGLSMAGDDVGALRAATHLRTIMPDWPPAVVAVEVTSHLASARLGELLALGRPRWPEEVDAALDLSRMLADAPDASVLQEATLVRQQSLEKIKDQFGTGVPEREQLLAWNELPSMLVSAREARIELFPQGMGDTWSLDGLEQDLQDREAVTLASVVSLQEPLEESHNSSAISVVEPNDRPVLSNVGPRNDVAAAEQSQQLGWVRDDFEAAIENLTTTVQELKVEIQDLRDRLDQLSRVSSVADGASRPVSVPAEPVADLEASPNNALVTPTVAVDSPVDAIQTLLNQWAKLPKSERDARGIRRQTSPELEEVLRLTQTALDHPDITQDGILPRLRDNLLDVYLRFQLGATQREAFENPEYVRFHAWSAMLYVKCRGLFMSRELRA